MLEYERGVKYLTQVNEIRESSGPLVSIKGLKKYFDIPGKGKLHAVDDVSFDIYPHETIGLVGESGCGKSTVANLITRLLDPTDGSIEIEGRDLARLKSRELFDVRSKVQMVFQDPYSSLNPQKTVKAILAEALHIHGMDRHKIGTEVKRLAAMVGLEEYVLNKFPHELDGGKRQMVGIARALSLNPKFIVCDEPVSALDVSIQATILNLLEDLQHKLGLTYLFVSHDLSVVRHISNRVAVMYLGQIIELASTDEIFENTLHPYSIALLSAVPKVEFGDKTGRIVLEGDVPSPLNPKPGCRFAPRCWMAKEECFKLDTPKLVEISPGHAVACHFVSESRERSRAAIEKKNSKS